MKRSRPSSLNGTLFFVVIVLALVLGSLAHGASSASQPASQTGSVVLGSGSLNRATDIQGNTSFSPQRAAPVAPSQVENLNL